MKMSSSKHSRVKDLTSRLVYIAIFGSMASAGFGFDQGWVAGSLSQHQFAKAFGHCDTSSGLCALSDAQLSYGTGIASAATIIGLFAGGALNERYGRRWTMMIQTIIATVGILIEVVSFTSYAQLTVGRFLANMAGGMSSNVVPVYQAECAPQSLRGAMTACYNIFLLLGATMSAIILYVCRNIQSDYAFRIVFILQFMVPVLLFSGWFFLPESPRWLVKNGRFEEATKVIQGMRKDDHDAEEEVRLLRLQLDEERELHTASTYMDSFRGTNLRRTIIATGPQILQQAQGIAFMSNYLAIFLVGLGFTNILELLVILYSVGVVANALSFLTNDTVGRRAGLLWGAIIQAITMLAVGGLTSGGTTNLSRAAQSGVTAMLVVWFFVFQLTWGPLAWVISGEAPTNQLREKTVSISAFGSYGVSLPINFCNPYVQSAIGSNVIFIYGGFSILTIVFVFFVIPEMKNRTLEELDELFNKKIAARKFAKYVCSGLGAEIKEVEITGHHHVAEKNGVLGEVRHVEA